MKFIITIFAIALMTAGCANNSESGTEAETLASTETAEQVVAETPKSMVQIVSAEKIKMILADYDGIIIDVRTPEETAQGIVPGAILLDINNPDFSSKIAELDRTKNLIVYCKAGTRSTKAAEMLSELNFPLIYNMQDGFDGWKSVGGEVAK